MNSEIRAWLNNEFYNKAFNTLQQEIILTTNVDNSAASTGYSTNQYACANTNDKIFLPSYAEMLNTSYGFSSSTSSHISRERLTSDYSRATGAWMWTTAGSQYGNGFWWLRSPISNRCNLARSVNCDGSIYSTYSVPDTSLGVVPALRIQL